MGALPFAVAGTTQFRSSFFSVSIKQAQCELRRAAAQPSPCVHGVPNFSVSTIRASAPTSQNEDLPPVLPKKKKRPFITPIKRGSHQRKLKARAAKFLPPKQLKAPENGLLLEKLIPVAHTVLTARATLLDGVARLLKVLPVKACRLCSEVHVAKVGHTIRTCQGRNSGSRFAHHEWIAGYLEDIVVPVDAFHLDDRLAKAPKHDKRFEVDRIPAILELCSQAGVDLPDHPTLRRTSPIAPKRRAMQDEVEADMEMESEMVLGDLPLVVKDRRTWKTRRDEEFRTAEIDEMQNTASGSTQKDVFWLSGDVTLEDNLLYSNFEESNFEDRLQFQARSEKADVNAISDEDDMQTVAQKTLQAWDTLRWGATLLMKSYPVKACGYCPEVHIGPTGHKVRMCGAFKHQWRKGQHGWQEAALDDLIPPSLLSGAAVTCLMEEGQPNKHGLVVFDDQVTWTLANRDRLAACDALLFLLPRKMSGHLLWRYVWHVRDPEGSPLINSFRSLYGKTPAVVELCAQAGAEIPGKYKPRMRLDVVIPDLDEFENVV